jgi:hypothetical protein
MKIAVSDGMKNKVLSNTNHIPHASTVLIGALVPDSARVDVDTRIAVVVDWASACATGARCVARAVVLGSVHERAGLKEAKHE